MLRDPARTLLLACALASGLFDAARAAPDPPPPPAAAPVDSAASGVTEWAPEAAFDTLRVQEQTVAPPDSAVMVAIADSLAPLAARLTELERAGHSLPEIDRKVLAEIIAAAREMASGGDEEAARLLLEDALRFHEQRSR